MQKNIRLAVVMAPLAFIGAMSPLHAEWRFEGFMSPTGNIVCAVYFEDGFPQTLICEIGEHTSADPPPPSDCDGDWGGTFSVEKRGDTAQLNCVTDSIRADYPIIGYGSTWENGGFKCEVERQGVTCRNQDGHGFFLSKAEREMF
jgi:hypothetical protein